MISGSSVFSGTRMVSRRLFMVQERRTLRRQAVAGGLGIIRENSTTSRGKGKHTETGKEHLADRGVALRMAIKQIESTFGKGSLLQMDGRNIQKVDVISTGSLGLDIALGVGGLPRGRVVEIFGPESSGKTTIALQCIAQAQKEGGTTTFIDAEHAFDATYATNLGVDMEKLYISQPDSGEQALEIADTLVRSGAVDVVVIDSVAALVPRVELEGEMGDANIALQARLMSQALRKLTASLSKSNCLLIFINQIRQRVGIIFGNPEVTAGGTALRFYSSVRLDIRRKAQIKRGDQVVGNETTVSVVKNKLAPPFRKAHFSMIYGQGVDYYSELIDIGVEAGIVTRAGSWYTIPEGVVEDGVVMLGQGKAKAKEALTDRYPNYVDVLETKIREKMLPSGDYENKTLSDPPADSMDPMHEPEVNLAPVHDDAASDLDGESEQANEK